MKYAQKRLIAGLGMGRETARPCYSLALAQVRWGLVEGDQPWWGVRRADVSVAGKESVIGLRREKLGWVTSELMGGVPTWRWRKCLQRSPDRWLSSFLFGTWIDRLLRCI